MKVETDEAPIAIRAWRLWVLLAVFAAGLATLLWRLWQVQVLDSPRYGAQLSTQSFRRVQTPGLRGRILDRNGNVLAGNRAAYSVVLYCEELRLAGRWEDVILAVDALIDTLAHRLALPREISRADVREHVRKRLPMPLELWRDVDYRTLAYLSEWAESLPGVDIVAVPRRHYPYGTLAAHVLGYVGEPRERDDEARRWHYRLPEFRGRSGLELYYDRLLTGTSGEDLLRVDSRGYTRERFERLRARPGSDLALTLDVQLQQSAEAALAGRPGAVVVLDPRNGDVLAMASAPTYDPNSFIPSIPQRLWRELNANPGKPFLNRAIMAQYAPGSVFKPFVAIAALERGINPDHLHECTGIYTEYNLRLRCANRYGHGEVDLRQALMKSCNPYFCDLGTRVGAEALLATAQQAGFGARTGIDLPAEGKGFLPTPEWKLAREGRHWTPSDTAQSSIGQGAITATPLQVAHAMGALAVGGTVYRPRLVSFGDGRGDLQRSLPWSHDALRAVIEGMEAAVSGGTGKTMRVEGINVAGKTGTAEYIDRGVRRKHVWCTAFAPIEKPEIVVVAMLDNGIGGGRDAGPIVQKVLSAHFRAKTIAVRADDEALED